MTSTSCLLCGVGGQGTVLASKLLAYAYMQQGALSSVDAENANMIPVFVNNCEGLLVIPKEEDSNSTLMWFDPERNLQFTLDAPLGQEDILHMAESVYLVETTK